MPRECQHHKGDFQDDDFDSSSSGDEVAPAAPSKILSLEGRKAVDFVDKLPEELVDKIFFKLDPKDLALAALVSQSWRISTGRDSLWVHQCLIRGWLKQGMDGSLLNETSSCDTEERRHSVAGTSPYFSLQEVENCGTLPVLSKWKSVFIRMQHLIENWCRGRYIALPLLRGHKDRVLTIACDGQILASGSADGLLKMWDVTSGRCRFTTKIHSDAINALQIVDGLVITACSDHSIRVFDVSTGEFKFSLLGHNSPVEKLVASPQHVLSVGADRRVRLWSLPEAKLLDTFREHDDDIECVALYGRYAATGSWDNNILLYDLRERKIRCKLEGHSEVVNCIEMNARILVSGGGDSFVKLWDIFTGNCAQTLVGHDSEVYCVAFNDDVIASGAADSTVRIWTYSGLQKFILREHLGVVRCLYINNVFLVSGGDQKKLYVWDFRKGRLFNGVHRQPTLLHQMWCSPTKIVTASPDKPGTVSILSYW